jgi:hypothetical protein
LAGALLFDEKIRQSVSLFWFGLWDVRVSSNIPLTSRNPKNNCDFPAFLETGLVEKISVCVHTTRVPNKKED